MIIRKANDDEKIVIKQMWKDNFNEDSDEYIDFYFENVYSKENTYVLIDNNEIITSLQTNPHQIVINGKIINTSYIVGVCTKNEYRRKGYMKKLLDYVMEELNKKEILTLIQAYDFNLYKPFGFDIVYYKNWWQINSDNYLMTNGYVKTLDFNCLDNDFDFFINLYYQYNKDKNGYAIRNRNYYKRLFKELNIEKCLIKTYQNNNYEYEGYMLYKVIDDKIQVIELVYITKEALNNLISSLYELNKIIHVESAINDDLTIVSNECKKIPFLMVKVYDINKLNNYLNTHIEHIDELLKDNGFINEYI